MFICNDCLEKPSPSGIDMGAQEASASRLADSQVWAFRRREADCSILQSLELGNLRNLS